MRTLDAAKKLLAEAGYSGEPVTCVVAQDQPNLKAMGEVTADLLKKMGMNVDFVATDWGTVGARRAQKTPPGQGGWNMFHTWHAGADCINPASYTAIRGNADKAWFGWPNSPSGREGSRELVRRKDLDDEKVVIARLNKAALDDVIFAPTGFFLELPGLAEERDRRHQGPAAVLLGRLQGLTLDNRMEERAQECSHSSSGGSSRPFRSWHSSRCSSSRLLYIAPGDPAVIIAGDQATPADVEKIRQGLGLDRPFLVRFGEWVFRILQGDLGTSIFTGLPVTQLIAQRIEPTVSLMIVTLILAIVIAVPMGVIAAWKAGQLDRPLRDGASASSAFRCPVFVVGYLLAYVFALQLDWLPVQGYTPICAGASGRGSRT